MRYLIKMLNSEGAAGYAVAASLTDGEKEGNEWLVIFQPLAEQVDLQASAIIEDSVYLECLKGAEIFRRPDDGGPIYLSPDNLVVSYSGPGQLQSVLLAALHGLGFEDSRITNHGNDILIDGKKAFGLSQAFGFTHTMTGLNVDPARVGQLIKPIKGKTDPIERVGAFGVSVSGLINALETAYEAESVVDPKGFEGREAYSEVYSLLTNENWIRYGVKPGEEFKMESIQFEGIPNEYDVDNISINTVDGKEQLSIWFSRADIPFSEIRSIFTDKAKTGGITIYHSDQRGTAAYKINYLSGFTAPISLSYETNEAGNASFVMVLSRA